MSLKIAFVMDPLEGLSLKKDSTLAMIRAAQRRGWEVSYLQQGEACNLMDALRKPWTRPMPRIGLHWVSKCLLRWTPSTSL